MPRSNFYSGSRLDRADFRRGDISWLESRLRHPTTRILPLWRSRHLVGEGPQAIWLSGSEIDDLLGHVDHVVFLGVESENVHVTIDLSHLEEPERHPTLSGRGDFRDLREFGPVIERSEGAVLAYARGLLHWHNRHRFCGVCGSATESAQAGHVRRCTNPDCGTSHFPRTDPAVIMLVHDGGDHCVLGRQKIWLPGMHSTLAGFVEPGESLEEAVAREVFEEVGIKVAVKDISYHSSQPWPFPSSIMLGFHARCDRQPLRVSELELESAGWFSRQELLASPEDENFRFPRKDSIARRLIEDWLAEG